MREALKTEYSLGKDIDKLRSEMIQEKELLKKEIADLKAALSDMTTKPMENVAWQSLHAAAAAACRGSTKNGGHGRHPNQVFPKLNTDSCNDLCRKTKYKVCDADISILGTFGKATSYTQRVGSYYNYGCNTAGNTDPQFDEVKSDNHEIISENPNYFRYCCCRYA